MSEDLGTKTEEPRRDLNILAALAYATEHDNVADVRSWLGYIPIDPADPDPVVMRTLSLAITCGHTRIVDLLLERPDVDPDSKKFNLLAPLHAAANSGFVAVAKLLLEKRGANPNIQDNEERTPLMWVIAKLDSQQVDFRSVMSPDHWSTMQFLINWNTTDINARDKYGRTALWYAAAIGNKRCVHSLALHPSIQPHIADGNGRTALSVAAERGHKDVTAILLQQSVDAAFYLGLKDKTGRTPLSWAVRFNTSKINDNPTKPPDLRDCGALKLLLEFAAKDHANKLILESDHQSRSALSFAVQNYWSSDDVVSEAIRLLLESRNFQLDTMDQEGRTVLSRGAEAGRKVVMEQLLQYEGVELDARDRDGRTPLSVAAANGRSIDLNAHNEQHQTALHLAAIAGHEYIVQSLLACKDVNTECLDNDGHTPLALAAMKKHTGVVKLLTKNKAVMQKLIREEGNLSYIRSLLHSGYGMNSKDSYGHTPLHAAISWNQPKIVEELLRWSPDINLEDASGLTPIRIAVNSRCKDIIDMVLQHSASTTGILPKDWFYAYNRQPSLELLKFSQNTSAEKSVNFLTNGADRLQLKPETDRHLVLFYNYDSWCEHLTTDISYPSDLDEHHIYNQIQGHHDFKNIVLIGQYPVEHDPQDAGHRIDCRWNKCAIAWSIKPPSKSINSSSWVSMVHLSMVPHEWIPASGTAFFASLLQRLKLGWLAFCNSADITLSHRRYAQLQAHGNNADLITLLAEDAQSLAKLRNVLRGQIHSAKRFADEYCHLYDREGGQRKIQQGINDYDTEVSERIRQLEQTVKDLLQFEFAWVSINEAHRSTSIATSVKRLSWVTFIFLPAMFASSLFGMNVNILESNPDWRWFLLFVGILLMLTISVWLFFKYGQVERWIEHSFGSRIQRLTQGPKVTKKRTLPPQKTV